LKNHGKGLASVKDPKQQVQTHVLEYTCNINATSS
jgi:hypothetical protein